MTTLGSWAAQGRCRAATPATNRPKAPSSGAASKDGPYNIASACTVASSVETWSARRAARIARYRVGAGASSDSRGSAARAECSRSIRKLLRHVACPSRGAAATPPALRARSARRRPPRSPPETDAVSPRCSSPGAAPAGAAAPAPRCDARSAAPARTHKSPPVAGSARRTRGKIWTDSSRGHSRTLVPPSTWRARSRTLCKSNLQTRLQASLGYVRLIELERAQEA
jgi:hypothetical protein